MPSGVRTDQEEPIMQMKEKRLRKQEAINRLSKKFTRVHHYGSGNHLVFAYGSTALELREAQKYHDFELVVPIYLDPFPEEELQQYAGKQAIVVEHATSPSFARLLKEKLHLNVVKNILRYDGRTFAPRDLAKAIAEVHNA
jgi:pyruvate/2-oxoacid:ferredoxin oxidoreductase alpha subunit